MAFTGIMELAGERRLYCIIRFLGSVLAGQIILFPFPQFILVRVLPACFGETRALDF
jgi:hypothetical protein